MNEDYFPAKKQEISLSKTVEDYQKDFLAPILDTQDKIQWIIDYIRKTLKEVRFHFFDSLSEEEIRKIKAYRKEKKDQMEVLRICESNIKQDTNRLLNAIASSVNLNWDDYNLTKIIGFNSGEIKCSDNLIPLPLQSQFYMISTEYCILIKCALNAVILKYEVDAICKKPYGKLLEEIKEIKELFNERKKISPNIQKDLAEWVISGMKKYCMNHKGIVEEGIRLPRKPTIISMFNHWNKYLKASNDEKEKMKDYKPYPKYEDILYAKQEDVENWGERIFAPTCWEERRRKKDKKRIGKKRDAFDGQVVEGDAGERLIDAMYSNGKTEYYYDDPN